VYGNEPLVGEGLKEFIAGGSREQLFVTSKVGGGSAARGRELVHRC
jgi:diketogulonate reductase-like aldo/keto reductase